MNSLYSALKPYRCGKLCPSLKSNIHLSNKFYTFNLDTVESDDAEEPAMIRTMLEGACKNEAIRIILNSTAAPAHINFAPNLNKSSLHSLLARCCDKDPVLILSVEADIDEVLHSMSYMDVICHYEIYKTISVPKDTLIIFSREDIFIHNSFEICHDITPSQPPYKVLVCQDISIAKFASITYGKLNCDNFS